MNNHSVPDYQRTLESGWMTKWTWMQENSYAGIQSASFLWSTVYDLFGRDDQLIYVIGSWLVAFIIFCLTNLILAALDVTGRPRALHKYKIQQDQNVLMKWGLFRQTMGVAGFNMTVVTLLHTMALWPLARWRIRFESPELPDPITTLWHLAVCLIVLEVGFYYQHRFMHRCAFLYKHIHKYHHSWKAPCAMATFYCHPLEHFFVNLFPLTLGPIMAGAHISTAWLWYIVCLLATTLSHSGYHFPFLPSSESHDFHHSRGIENYGTVGFLDWLHGTNQRFRNSPVYQRHYVILRLTPAHVHAQSKANTK